MRELREKLKWMYFRIVTKYLAWRYDHIEDIDPYDGRASEHEAARERPGLMVRVYDEDEYPAW